MVDMEIEIAGLKFRNPVLTAAGPTTRNSTEIRAAVTGGAGGIVCKTISTEAAIIPHPNMAVINRKRNLGLVNTELWSELPPEEWFTNQYPAVRRAVDQAGISVIGSVGYSPEQVTELVPKMVEAGCQGIEFSTHYIDNAEAVPKAIREALGDDSIPVFAKMSPHRHTDLEKMVKDLSRLLKKALTLSNKIRWRALGKSDGHYIHDDFFRLRKLISSALYPCVHRIKRVHIPALHHD